jgi:hypothetical protein
MANNKKDGDQEGARKLHLSVKRMKKLRSEVKAGHSVIGSIFSSPPWTQAESPPDGTVITGS